LLRPGRFGNSADGYLVDDVESGEKAVILVVEGLSEPAPVSAGSISRLLASRLPRDLEGLGARLESTKHHLGADPSGMVKVDARERGALQQFIFKAKYEQPRDMPLDLSDLEEQLRPSE
jgi:hypothetical protein